MPYRKTAIRHPLKRVRSIIGIDQRTVANRVKCSLVTIKRIEQGTLALSRSLADKLEASLGVSAAYLRHGKASHNPITPTGEPFTKDTFDRRELEIREGTMIQSAAFFPFRWAALLGAIADSAGEKNRLLAFHYEVEALALKLQKKFGIDRAAERDLKKLCTMPHEAEPKRWMNLLMVAVHDRKMPFETVCRLAQMDGLPYKATTKTKTVRLRPDPNKAANAYDKLTAKKAGVKLR